MKLFIHNQYQEAIEIEIAAMAKIHDLKEMITARIKDILVSDQILKFRSKILSDSDMILASGIEPNSVIELSLNKSYYIFVKTEDNRIHEIRVHFTNTVELIKKLLNRLLKIAVDKQRLLFNGKELKNGDMLTDKSIIPGTTIDLRVINLNLHLDIVHQRSGHTERIEIQKNATIAQLKEKISAKYKVPGGYQILKYNDQVLDNNNKTVADYNVENLSEINFRPNDYEIMIQFRSIGRNNLAVRVLPIDTIGMIKEKIEAETKLRKSSLQLIWNGKMPGDDVILSDEKIYGGSALSLILTVQSLKLKIQVGPEEKIRIDAQSSETIAELKSKLLKVTNIPIDQQILFLDNEKLVDGKMLFDYGINENSDIALQRKDSFEIFVESFSGKKISIRAHKTDSVSQVRAQIDRRLGIKPEDQRLLYCAQELQNKSLESYEITSHCTLHLVIRVNGGTIFKL